MKRIPSRRRPLRPATAAPFAARRPTLRSAWRLGRLVLWGGTLAALIWGAQRLQAYVRGQPAPEPPRLAWVELPDWLRVPGNRPVLDEIQREAALPAGASIHDPDLARRIGQQLARSPWIRAVERVAKHPDGTVRVHASFREPLAYVDVAGRALLVDADGVRLPVECSSDLLGRADWFLITGVRAPAPDPGELWPGADLAAGLKLVRYLRQADARRRLPFRPWLTAIDVANFDRSVRPLDGRLRIRTVYPGCYINWGEPPDEDYPVEPSPDGKLEMLATLYNELGQLPELVLDVRDKGGFLRMHPPRGT